MLRSKKLVVFFLVFALAISQFSVLTFAAVPRLAMLEAGTSIITASGLEVTVTDDETGRVFLRPVYLDKNGTPSAVLPSGMNVKLMPGILAWPSSAANAITTWTNAPGALNSDFEIPEGFNGWFTVGSWGTNFYTVGTYKSVDPAEIERLRVISAQIGLGLAINAYIENSQTAGNANHDPGTFVRLPSFEDRNSSTGNFTNAAKNTVPHIFALGSTVAPWSGPGHFKTPALNPANFRDRPLYQWTTQNEQAAFISTLNATNQNMYLFDVGNAPVGTTALVERFPNGMEMPMAVFTTSNLTGLTIEEAGEVVRENGKPTYFHGANIHGNEQSSGEAALALIYDMAATPWGAEVLADINVIVVPRINPTGHARHNRSSDVNVASQAAVDMNRDHMVLKTQEIWNLHYAWNQFLPEVVGDGHELGWLSFTGTTPTATIGSNWDFELTPATSLNVDPAVTALAVNMANNIFRDAEASGIRMGHYGMTNNNSIGRAYYGNMNALSFVLETRGQNAGLMERRTYAQYMAGRSMIATLRGDAENIMKTVAGARQKVIDMGTTYNPENLIVTRQSAASGGGLNPIPRWSLSLNGSYAAAAANTLANGRYAANAAHNVTRPTGYIVPKTIGYELTGGTAKLSYNAVIEKLLKTLDGQGIEYFELEPGMIIPLEQIYITSTTGSTATTNPGNDNFRAANRAEANVAFPDGAYLIPMDQVAGNVIAILMQPENFDSASGTGATTSHYGGTFAQGLVNSSNNEIVGGNNANTFLHDAENNFPIYRYVKDNPRGLLDILELVVTDDAPALLVGDEFNVNASFNIKIESNALTLEYEFDKTKFEPKVVDGAIVFEPAAGVTFVTAVATDKGVKVTLAIQDYEAKEFGNLPLIVIDDLKGDTYKIKVECMYVTFDKNRDKVISGPLNDCTEVTGYVFPTKFTIIQLSHVIDWFGVKVGDTEWPEARYWDVVQDGVINILDIQHIAANIG